MSAPPERETDKTGGWLELLALLAALLAPLALTPLPFTADGRNHILRTVVLTHSVAAGEGFPRYSPELVYGFGAPLFHYYAPLTYYLTALVSALGLGPSFGFQVVLGASLLLGSLGAALWAGSWFGPRARLVAGVAWAAWPYVLYDVYTRGAGPEVLGLAWLPWIGWSLSEGLQRGTLRSRVGLALSVGGLLLSHNLTALLGAGLLAIIALMETGLAASQDRRVGLTARLLGVAAAGAIGATATAFFWVPAVLETSAVRMSAATDLAGFDFRDNFLSPSSLLTGTFTFDPRRVLPPVPISLGWGALVLAGLGLAAVFGLGRLPKRADRVHGRVVSQTGRDLPGSSNLAGRGRAADNSSVHTADLPGRLSDPHHARIRIAVSLTLAVGCVLMTLSVTRPIWEVLPLAQLIQFPSRWLGPAGLWVALLGGAGVRWLELRWPSTAVWAPWALAGGLVVVSWPWTFSKPDPTLLPAPTLQALYAAEVDLQTLGLTSTGEFLPIGAIAPVPDPGWAESVYAGSVERVDRARLAGDVVIETVAQDRLSAQVNVTSAAPVDLTFRWLYWPGWQATLDGAPVPVQASPSEGFVQVAVPAGRHQLTVWLGLTPLRQAAQAISLTGLIAGAVLLVAACRRQHPSDVERPARVRVASALPMALGLGLALLVVRVTLEIVPNPLRATRFDGQTVAGISSPRQLRFGDSFTLLGIDAPTTVAADQALTVTAYWTAAAPVGQDLSYSLQLWDQENVFLSQADVMNPGGFPVRRWSAGDYASDTLSLDLDPSVPPGRLRLLVTVYTTDDPGVTVPGRSEAGPLESYIEVGEVVVTRARTPTRPDAFPGVVWRAIDTGPLAAVGAAGLPGAVQAGDALRLELYWVARAALDTDSAHLLLRDAQGAEHDLGPARLETADFPRAAWLPGDVWRFQTPVVVPADAAGGPAEWVIRTGRGEQLLLGAVTVTVPERTFDPPGDLLGQTVSFDQIADLVGYRLSGQARPGETLTIDLVWRSTAATARSLTAFVQVLGTNGFPIAQSDRVPAEGQRPTTGWLPPEVIVDRHTISLPDTLPPGAYPLTVGLYEPLTGERISVSTGADIATLRTLEVESE